MSKARRKSETSCDDDSDDDEVYTSDHDLCDRVIVPGSMLRECGRCYRKLEVGDTVRVRLATTCHDWNNAGSVEFCERCVMPDDRQFGSDKEERSR